MGVYEVLRFGGFARIGSPYCKDWMDTTGGDFHSLRSFHFTLDRDRIVATGCMKRPEDEEPEEGIDEDEPVYAKIRSIISNPGIRIDASEPL